MAVVEVKGASIPAMGLGTMSLKEQQCIDTVKTALRLGYRHLDTAERYGNEQWVGEGLHQGLAANGLKRDDVFVTTKVYWDKLGPGDFEKSVEQSLEKLKLPSVDLLLIHWNNPKVPLADSIKSLCAATEPLVTNQIEVHPFLDQTRVIAACRKHGMSVTAYCPIARGKVPGNSVLERIGKAHRKSAAQVALRYLVQQGIIPIPRTANPDHLAANLAVFDFKLSDADMAEISGLKRPDGRVVNPAHAPQWDA
jgi:2,5-diketo-D-gluconate reductase B